MKKIYSKTSSLVINLEAEQMIAASGDMSGKLPDFNPEPASNQKNSSIWGDASDDSNIWK